MKALRGATLSFKSDPFLSETPNVVLFHGDALVVVEDGWIRSVAPCAPEDAWGLEVTDYPNALTPPASSTATSITRRLR